MQTGHQLQSLFVMILLHCSPVDPHCLWVDTKHHLCDDLQYQLIHCLHMPDPTEDQVYDYGLYLINVGLQKSGKSLQDFADMPVPQIRWENRVGNQLIAEQCNYDLNALHQIVANGEGTLTNEQRAVYDAMLTIVENNQAGGSLLHSAGGCGKTYVCNLLAAAVRAREKIVLCMASSGIASLLLSGGWTAHSRFKIPIPINEASTCNIKKDDLSHELLLHTSLIIWDEVPMQHQHVIECVNCSLHDLHGVDADFGDFSQPPRGAYYFYRCIPLIGLLSW